MTIPLVRVRYLSAYVHACERLGGDVGRTLRRARLSPELLAAPTGLVPLKRVSQFVQLAARDVGPRLGLVAAPRRLADLGSLGQCVARAPTLLQAFSVLSHMARREATGTEFFVRREQGSVWFCRTTIPVDDDALLAHVETYVVETMLVLARHWLGDAWQPGELWLQGKPQAGDDRFAEIPRVRYRASLLAFPVALRDCYASGPAPSHDPSPPSGLPEAPLDTLGFVGSLARVLETHLPLGRASLPELAELLGTSPRTLQRRLDAHGSAYSSLLDDVRQRLALDRLRRTDDPITQIAHDLAYSDSAHFTRAFRRWTGMSPLAMRRLHRER